LEIGRVYHSGNCGKWENLEKLKNKKLEKSGKN